MKLKLINSGLTFASGQRATTVEPTKRLTGYVVVTSSSNNKVFVTANSTNNTHFYDLVALQINAGDTLHVKATYETSRLTGAMFFSDNNLTESDSSSQWMGANVGEKITGRTEGSYGTLDQDIVVPAGAKLLCVSYRNTIEGNTAEVKRYQ